MDKLLILLYHVTIGTLVVALTVMVIIAILWLVDTR
jgi:preprotein translocase subunit SecE